MENLAEQMNPKIVFDNINNIDKLPHVLCCRKIILFLVSASQYFHLIQCIFPLLRHTKMTLCNHLL